MNLQIEQIEDPIARENFQRLQDDSLKDALPKGQWKFFEIIITKAVTNLKYPHSLGFAPKDIIQTSLKGAGALTWNYNLFDSTNLNITTTGACTVRVFVGHYSEGIV